MDLISIWGFERVDFEFKHITGINTLCDLIDRETKKG